MAKTKFRPSAASKALLPENHNTFVLQQLCQCVSPFWCLFTGACVATTLGKGFLAIRKAGHLCVATQSQGYSDYTSREKTMEVRLDVLKPGEPAAFFLFFTLMVKTIVNAAVQTKTVEKPCVEICDLAALPSY